MDVVGDSTKPKVHVTVPLPVSVNHLYRRARLKDGRVIAVKTAEALRWDKAVAAIAKTEAHKQGWKLVPKGRKVVVEIVAFWPDCRMRDMHNLHKQVADVLEGIAYEDDAYALLRDVDFTVDRNNPRLEVLWYEES